MWLILEVVIIVRSLPNKFLQVSIRVEIIWLLSNASCLCPRMLHVGAAIPQTLHLQRLTPMLVRVRSSGGNQLSALVTGRRRA